MDRDQDRKTAGRGPAPACPVSLLDMQDKDPFAFYEERRAEGPVVWDEGMQAWLVLDFDLCRKVLMNEKGFANPYANSPPQVVKIKGGPSNITLTRGSLHARLRRFHISLLTPKAVADYTGRMVQPIIHFLIDRFAAQGEADLAAGLADQLPTRVILALMGMPWDDDALVARVFALHEEIMAYIGHNYDAAHEESALAAAAELDAMLIPYIRLRATEPGEDFISQVWHQAPDEFGKMTEEIVLGICRELFLGGGDTTVHGIANTLYLVLTEPDVRAAIEANRDKGIKAAIEETMRLLGSVQYRYRIAQEDCELGGRPIARDQKLVLLSAAANRDPQKFACPAEIDLERPKPTDHLAFGAGPRACVGSLLARSEIYEAVDAVLDRLPGLRLDPDEPKPVYRGVFMRSCRPLFVRWEPRS